jgi:hypothetical protein
MSEFLLSLASPEFWSVWGFRALMFGLAGDLLVIFVPSQRHALEKSLAVTFSAFVFGGVYVGHVGDDAISARFAERADRAELELEKFRAARKLGAEQQERITAKAKSFSGASFDIATMNDKEPFNLAEMIETALLAAGWKEVDWTGNPLITRNSKSSFGIAIEFGVSIQHEVTQTAELGAIANMLAAALHSEGIEARAEVSGTNMPSTSHNAIHVIVGKKP